MNKATLKKMFRNLRAGQTIYWVYDLAGGSFIRQLQIFSGVKSDGRYVYFNSSQGVASVMDANGVIGENGYNLHKCFSSKKKAEKYLQDCKRYKIRHGEFASRSDTPKVPVSNMVDDDYLWCEEYSPENYLYQV